MTNLYDIKKHFKILYPKCTKKLNDSFEYFLDEHQETSSNILEESFLFFITQNMRVDLPQSMSFLESITELQRIKKNITQQVDNKKLIPGFITKNILTMPSNRGYMWKNKKYHGKQSPVDGPVVLFEPRRGKTFIHVYEKTCHKIYEKMKGEKIQILIKTEYVPKKSPTPITQFLNKKTQ